MAHAPIPFNRPGFMGRERRYMAEAVAYEQISGNGYFGKRCEALLEKELGVARVLLTTSCTHALEMAAMLLDVGAGDEVIVPSFTFVSTVNAFVLRGARPVFADIRADTMNLDEAKLESYVTPRTKAVVPVHYAGVACEMDPILEVARRHRLRVVEDTAHGLFGAYRSRQLGTLGELATLSFHETKNFTCGEGGALIVNDLGQVERAEMIRDKGTNRARFFRGQVDKYTWTDIGSSYVLSDILGAFLLAQLEARHEIQARRLRIWDYYLAHLGDWAQANGASLPHVPAHVTPSSHLFYLLLPSLQVRQALIEHLRLREILAVFHYQPLHLSPMGRRFGGAPGDCPVTERVSDRLLRLPFYNHLSEPDQARVVEAIREFRP